MPFKPLALCCALYALVLVGIAPAQAEQNAMFMNTNARGSLFSDQPRSLIAPTGRAALNTAQGAAAPKGNSGSLFSGQTGTSFFAPLPEKPRGNSQRGTTVARLAVLGPNAGPIERLRHLIASAEAGKKGYDAVQYGATKRPARRPTAMTVQEIYDWIAATPGQPHAIGRYQFIPPTLKRLMKKLRVSPSERFSPQLQDRLADQLLAEAGLDRMLTGDLSRRGFMNNIAKIWAGLPNSTGKSHYAGYAGNKATMTWTHFEREMKSIFPGPA